MSGQRPDSQSWTAAKTHGDGAEDAIARWFAALGGEVTKTIGPAGYDLLVLHRVEVKHDLRAAETGNVAIEVAYDDEPSGITATVANWWAIVIGSDEGLLVRTEILRSIVLSGRWPERTAGDGGRARVRLIPLDKLRRLPGVQTLGLRGES